MQKWSFPFLLNFVFVVEKTVSSKQGLFMKWTGKISTLLYILSDQFVSKEDNAIKTADYDKLHNRCN